MQRHPLLRLALWLNRRYVDGCHHLHALTPCPIPEDGPAILVCNHISGLDPVLIQRVCPRIIIWMIAREYYEMPALRWLFRILRAIPVERSGRDLAATRQALRALEDGLVLGLFPEGRISTTRQILPFQTGIGLLAVTSGAPVYPAGIEGTVRNQAILDTYLYANRAEIAFGDPLRFDPTHRSREAIDNAAVKIRQAVMEVRQRHLRSADACAR